MDNQSKNKGDLGKDKNLNREPNKVTGVNTTDQPKEGPRPHNSVSDADREDQLRREREGKDKTGINEPPKTKTATP
jgi:hypothetical protein